MSGKDSARDVTAAIAAEDLHASRVQQLPGIFLAMAEGLVIQSQSGEVVDANPAAERVLGLSRDQLLGRTSLDPAWRAVREDGSPFPGHEHPAMVTLRTGLPLHDVVMGVHLPDGGQRWIRINSEPVPALRAGDERGVVATFVDITEARTALNQVRHLVQRLQTVREDERQRVAHSLHEGIAQELFAMKIAVTMLKSRSHSAENVVGQCADLEQAIETCMDRARGLADGLRPTALRHSTLACALAAHCAQFSAATGIAARCSAVEALPDLGKAIPLQLFRAAEEALLHVARHARASSVDVDLRCTDDRLELEVRDDGRGMDTATPDGAFGLLALRESFAALRGEVSVEPAARGGTRLLVRVPLPNDTAIP